MADLTYENVLVDVDGPVATITLNRPEKLNALSRGLLADLHQALRDLNPGDDVRVHPPPRQRAGRSARATTSARRQVVYAGGKRGKKDGPDIADYGESAIALDREIAARDDRPLAVDVELPQADHRPGARLLPVGRARPDRRVRHRLGRRGHAVRPPGGAWHRASPSPSACCRCKIGAAATKELLFTGDLIDAEEAQALGLIRHVVAGRRARRAGRCALPAHRDEPARRPHRAQARHQPQSRDHGPAPRRARGRRVRRHRPPHPVDGRVRPARRQRRPARRARHGATARTPRDRRPTTTPPSRTRTP